MNQQSEQIRVEYVALRSLERWPRNPKRHSDEDIKGSIARFGYVQPIVVDERSGRIVAGHGRLDALTAMKATGAVAPARVGVDESGEWLVPVLRGVSFNSEQEAEAYLLADNRTVELGGWDSAGLGEMIRDLQQAEMPIIGWSDVQIEGLISVGAHERSAPGDAEPRLADRGLIYSVIVDLADEQKQGELLAELEGRGYKCRLLIS